MRNLSVENIVNIAGDIAAPVNGDVWYNSSLNKLRKRENGVTSDLDTSGGITRSVNNISANTTAGAVANTDYVYFCTGTITFTLPTAVGNTNKYTTKNIGFGIISIATTSSQTIDAGAAPITITRNNNSLDFISDNLNWKLI